MVTSDALTPLDVEDARILALESGPIRGHTVTVLIVDDAPGDGVEHALRAEVAQRLPAVTRWRQRLVSAPGTATGLAWQDDPDFDIARHVRAVRGGEPIGETDLRRIAAEVMREALDRERPLWTLDIVPRLAGGQWAILWKVHHALADGVTKMRAGARLLWTEQRSEARAPRPRPSADPGRSSRPLATLIGHRGLVLRNLRRVWQLSPLAAEVGSERATAFARCTLDELRRLGKAIAPEVTINDVLLALVAGALRRWLHAEEAPPARMKAQVPVSMHPHLAEDDPCGNRDSFLFVELPLKEADPVARVRAVSKATRKRKNRQDARAIAALRQSLGRAPDPVKRALQRFVQGPHEYSLNVSNVPGPSGPIQVLGRRVDAMYPLAEIAPHHALRVAALSLDGSLFIGLCADPRVIRDLDVLADGIRVSLDELRASVQRSGGTSSVTPDASTAPST